MAGDERGRPSRGWRIAGTICATIVGLAFVAAGISKAVTVTDFAGAIASYEMVDDRITPALAVYLPWLEIYTGLVLPLPAWRRTAGAVAAVLLLAFSVVLAVAWSQGRSGECGCGGVVSMTVPAALARNLVLLGLVGLAVRGSRVRVDNGSELSDAV